MDFTAGEVDRVYESAPDSVDICYNGKPALRVGKSSNLADFVVWNPHQAKSDALKDMEADGWKRYVCVEPGSVVAWHTLKPGQSLTVTQTAEVVA